MEDQLAEQENQTDIAYRERNQLVSYLTKQYPSYCAADADLPDWLIVYVETPAGQLSWHVGLADLDLFTHLEQRTETGWDGHTTAEKYSRLAVLGEMQ